jgi:GT2 family glycosyltransferase
MTHPAMQVHHLPGMLRVQTNLAIPPEHLRPRIATPTGRAWLDHGRPLPTPIAGAGLRVDIACNLAPHRRHPGRRLQIWACGFLLHEEALLPLPPRAGAIEAIEDDEICGWIAAPITTLSEPPHLRIDGRDIGPIQQQPTADPHIHRLRAALPGQYLDGRRHHIEIIAGDQIVATRHWRSMSRFNVTQTGNTLELHFADPALHPGGITVSAQSAGQTLLHRTLDPAGSQFTWDIPKHPGTITIHAGAHAGRTLATLNPSDPHLAITRARARAQALLLADPTGSHATRHTDRPTLNREPPPRTTHHLTASGAGRGVTVIVPVYRGALETQSCLASLTASADAGDAIDAIIVVDDVSPDPAIANILQQAAAPGAPVPRIVLRQHHNQGFAAAITRALAEAAPNHDIILLNADTIVPKFFAARLRAAAHSQPHIASATPLSNAASVLSLPDSEGANALTPTETMALDAALEAGLAPPLAIPTGHGFCLYLKREALDDTGPFSPEWGHGYCEEVDWCLRARDRGWSHVAARDVAVFHYGNVSFGTAQRDALITRNHPLLERRYPEYTGEIQEFLRRDPLAPLRAEAYLRLLAEADGPCLLHFTHAMGGGTAILVDALSDHFTAQGGINLVCSRIHDSFRGEDIFVIRWSNRALTLRLPHGEITGFIASLKALKPSLAMLVHSLTGVGPAIRAIAALGIPYAVYAHDYQWICPRVVLVDHTGLHCGEPGPRYCQLCVRANPIHDFAGEDADIRANLAGWISKNTKLLNEAQAVLIPSIDAFARLQKHFPQAPLRVRAHPERQRVGHITRGPDADPITRIAITGGLSVQKGRDVAQRLCRTIDATSAPFEIEIHGAIEEPELFAGITCATLHGPYERDTLADRLSTFNPHFVFFPAVWPETWCFALSDIWAAGYPAVAFDIGAIAERIRTTGAGIILPFEPHAELVATLRHARDAAARLHGLRFDIAPLASDDPARELFT